MDGSIYFLYSFDHCLMTFNWLYLLLFCYVYSKQVGLNVKKRLSSEGKHIKGLIFTNIILQNMFLYCAVSDVILTLSVLCMSLKNVSSDNIKVPSEESFYDIIAVDMFNNKSKHSHISKEVMIYVHQAFSSAMDNLLVFVCVYSLNCLQRVILVEIETGGQMGYLIW